jgi:hypothetical protein
MMKLAATVLAAVAATALTPRADAWTISQNFDSSAVGSSCGWDAGGGSTVSSTQAYSPKNSCQLTVTAGQTAYGMWGGVIAHPSNVQRGGQLWFRVRTFMPVGFNYNSTGEGDHLKFFRFHTMSNSNSNEGYDDIYINPAGSNPPFQFIYEGEQVWDYIGTLTGKLTGVLLGDNSDPIVLGQWETYEYWVKFDTVSVQKGGQAEVRFWKNGALMADMTDRITLATTDGYSDQTNLFTYWNGGAPATEAMYVDDLVLTTDTPSAKDAAGNPYIGVGPNPGSSSSSGGTGTSSTTPVVPEPPTSVSVN